jgi:hypothetical protein
MKPGAFEKANRFYEGWGELWQGHGNQIKDFVHQNNLLFLDIFLYK